MLFLLPFAGAQESVSLKEDPAIAQLDWVQDFTYKPQTTRAQRQEVVTYSMQMLEDHARSIRERNLPWVAPTASADENFVIGRSYGWPGEPRIEPLPIFGYQITDPSATGEKIKMILIGGNHPREDPSNWALHGLIEFLVSEDPIAHKLREHVIFYVYPVVNPDGRQYLLSSQHAGVMTVNGSPELKQDGETNHNRVWNTSGRFVSVDTVNAAMKKDTGGTVDYLLDFHGIPEFSTFTFTDEGSVQSPFGQAYLRRGMNYRRSEVTERSPAIMRNWAMHSSVAKAAFTPEFASQSIAEMMIDGQRVALALNDMIVGNEPSIPHLERTVQTSLKPQAPFSVWLLDGNAKSATGNGEDGKTHGVKWSDDTPFNYAGNRSVLFDNGRAAIDFGEDRSLDFRRSMTVSVWAKGESGHSDLSYLIGRYAARGEQRSWAMLHAGRNLTEFMVIVSADGSHDRNFIKRYLSALWPAKYVFDNTWRHLAFTYEGGDKNSLRLYVDGQELELGSGMHIFNNGQVAELFEAQANLRMGALEGSANAFQGNIDEVGIWSYALSPEEILWLSKNSLREITDR